MALKLTGAEDDEVTDFLNKVLDAYRAGLCSREDARVGLWQVLDAAIKQNPNFMNEVRGNARCYPDA